jgi:hypothetical protein
LHKKKTHIKGRLLYSTELFSYSKEVLQKRLTYDALGKLRYYSTYTKNSSGLVELIYNKNKELLWFCRHKITKNGSIYETEEFTPEKKLRQIYMYFYDENGLLTDRTTLTPEKKIIHHAQYSYKPNQNIKWTIRNEDQSYADVFGSPKEEIKKTISGKSLNKKTINEPRPFTISPDIKMQTYYTLHQKASSTSLPGGKVLTSALKHIKAKTIIKGSCYDWINMIYKESGYTGKKRKQIFQKKKDGQYADPLLLQPGDWIMFKNQSYGDSGHSGIFLHWINFETRSALVIGYVGQNRAMPGRYREYDITRTFGIIRGVH